MRRDNHDAVKIGVLHGPAIQTISRLTECEEIWTTVYKSGSQTLTCAFICRAIGQLARLFTRDFAYRASGITLAGLDN